MKITNTILKNTAFILSFLSIAVTVSSCGIEFTAYGYDDVYASPNERAKRQVNVVQRESTNCYQDPAYEKITEVYSDTLDTDSADIVEGENNYSSYDEDDYYDYAYSARIRRFHRPYLMYDYYADYYTNLYWYTYDPWYWGTSIYLGYHWWYPSYYSYYWGYPYYYGYYPYHHHHYYNHGHHYHNHGHNNVAYYNSHDRNSNFYRSLSTGSYVSSNNRFIAKNGQKRITTDRTVNPSTTFGDKYNAKFGSSAVTKGTINGKPVAKENATTFASEKHNRELQKPTVNNQVRLQKPPQNRKTITKPNINNRQGSTITNNNQRNINTNQNIKHTTRTYTPPAVRQPRSTNEFTRQPATKQNNNTFRKPATTSQRSISIPRRSNNSSTISVPRSNTRNNSSSFRSSSSSSTSRSSGTHSSGSSSSSSRSVGRK
jgi:hypothetical protein